MPGDLLATIELDKIIEAGYDPTVMVIDTADSSKRNVTLLAKNTAPYIHVLLKEFLMKHVFTLLILT